MNDESRAFLWGILIGIVLTCAYQEYKPTTCNNVTPSECMAEKGE